MASDGLQSEVDITPSYWSKRFSKEQIVAEHVKYITKHSDEVKNSIAHHTNIPYGPGKREVIDIYGTDLPQDAPVLIHFHGGFWKEPLVCHNNNTFIAKVLRENRIKTMFVGYQLCPSVTLEDISKNIEKAVEKCREHAKDAKSINFSGHSAGAQIVARLFNHYVPSLPEKERKQFKSAFLLAGIYDLLPLVNTVYNNELKLDEHSAKEASPLYQNLAANGTDFYVVIAEFDSPKFVEQGNQMHEYLSSLGLKSNLVLIKNVDHFDLIEKLSDPDYELTKLIVKCCS